MRSFIHDKILKLSLSGLVFCAVCVGGFGIFCVNSITSEYGREHLQLIGQKEALRIGGRFEMVEQYVKTLAYVVYDGLTDVDMLKDSTRREAFTEQNLNFMQSTIRNVGSAVAVYLRYNPEITPPTSGVFLAKTSKTGSIEKQVPTDFSKYEKDDVEHVGWYYVPLRYGRPIWMSPYENKNIDIYMVSYVMPLSSFDTEIGVVGVDLDFGYLVDEVAGIKVLNTGYAYLEYADRSVAYHPVQKPETFVLQNNELEFVRNPLPNGMSLVLVAPKAEINTERDTLIVQIALFTIFILVVFAIISFRISRSITRPLQELTVVANKMTSGNLDVNFDIDADDEVGELVKSFDNARRYMKDYVSYVKGVAYRDSLTGVRNKAAFDNYAAELQEKVDDGNVSKYAVVMFDVNSLKAVNDGYGHENGNALLVNACQMICKSFSHSAVFRIGGDEFVAVMLGEDFENRESVMADLDGRMRDVAEAKNQWERVSIAKGLAVYGKFAGETVEDVVRRADEAMYANKKAMKAVR